MLVLPRKQDQKIVVGNNITITILKIRGNTVRIGIDAPRDIHVMRGELKQQPAETYTLEFKSNGKSPAKGPTLRLVSDSAKPVEPVSKKEFTGVNRMMELVARVGGTSTNAQ